MNNELLVDELEQAITGLISDPEFAAPTVHSDIAELVNVASELRSLPTPEFKLRLKLDLMRQATATPGNGHSHSVSMPQSINARTCEQVFPTLFAEGYGSYPVHRTSLAASFAIHAAAITCVIASGFWMVQHGAALQHRVISELVELSPYTLPASVRKAGGGGGGGDRDKVQASKGNLPRASNQQVVPPAIVVRNSDPVLSAEPTVVAPPNLSATQTSQVGDPLSAVLLPSNGTGIGAGIGTGSGGGIGRGQGPGVGLGIGGGIGGGVYRVGGGVSA